MVTVPLAGDNTTKLSLRQDRNTGAKHKVIAPFEAIEEMWQGSCEAGKKRDASCKIWLEKKLQTIAKERMRLTWIIRL